jgi:uncharacterized membrane protein
MNTSLDGERVETILNEHRTAIWVSWWAATLIAAVVGFAFIFFSDDFNNTFDVLGFCSLSLCVVLLFCMFFEAPEKTGKVLVRRCLRIKEWRNDRSFLRDLKVKF